MAIISSKKHLLWCLIMAAIIRFSWMRNSFLMHRHTARVFNRISWSVNACHVTPTTFCVTKLLRSLHAECTYVLLFMSLSGVKLVTVASCKKNPQTSSFLNGGNLHVFEMFKKCFETQFPLVSLCSQTNTTGGAHTQVSAVNSSTSH